ncbi:TPA: hypothetical protein CPT85_04030 [Candidatus Gastranaerophilales bacterium HUM_21]|nr:MAG TPA: hypothetical protein CPT85_04030 [Candidatus Gastranaerophilales bacterium HUM_21]
MPLYNGINPSKRPPPPPPPPVLSSELWPPPPPPPPPISRTSYKSVFSGEKMLNRQKFVLQEFLCKKSRFHRRLRRQLQ